METGELGNGGELGNTGVRGQRGSVGAWFCPSTGGFALAPEVFVLRLGTCIYLSVPL